MEDDGASLPPCGDDLSATVELAQQLLGYLDQSHLCVVSQHLGSPTDFISIRLEEAKEICGLNYIYDDQLFDTLDLREFQEGDYKANDSALGQQPLDTILQDKLSSLRWKGLQKDELNELLRVTPDRHRVLDILTVGQRPFMEPGFIPNGGKSVGYGSSYQIMRRICNDSLLTSVREGKAIAFSKQALHQSGNLQSLHVNRTSWAEKAGKVKGRTCLNARSSSRLFKSLNESVDLTAHDQFYPPPELPTARNIAEMICQQREAFPGEELGGAIVDVSSAYNQYTQSVNTAKLQATQVTTPGPDGSNIELIIIWLVGIFGFTRSGNVFCVLSKAIKDIHNHGRTPKRCEVYVDDGILVSPYSQIAQSTKDYCRTVKQFFGPEGVNESKVKIWQSRLEAIGWTFDFKSWRMTPKAKGLAKLLICLFDDIPPVTRSTTRAKMDKLVGLLTWYALGIPFGRSYLSSLYACQNKRSEETGRVYFSLAAIQDLKWWRALVLTLYLNPDLIGTSIDSLRLQIKPDYYMRTDASTSVGGGAYISDTQGGVEIPMHDSAIRWTDEEFSLFKSHETSINILEYYTAIYYIMLWGNTFKGKVIYLECDNTSAVSWFLKQRSKSKNPTADALVRLFSLFCLHDHITIISTHIAGVNNVVADIKSRDPSIILPHQAAVGTDSLDGEPSLQESRMVHLRRILNLCLTRSEEMHSQRILKELTSLRGKDGKPFASSIDIPRN
jgi:hypothetical protein